MRATVRTFALPAVATLALVATLSGCRTNDCRDGTVLVALTLRGAAAGAENLRVTVTTPGGSKMQTVAANGITGGNLEVQFPNGYPKGETVTVAVDAIIGNAVVGHGEDSHALTGGCARFVITIGGGGDGGNASTDMSCTAMPVAEACAAAVCGRVSDGCNGFIECATPCQVASISPSLANTGDSVVIEGLFSGPTTVDFPGAPGQAATVLGPTRAVTVVPATATAGNLVVNTGNTALAPVHFRRAAFPLGWAGLIGGNSLDEPQPDIGRPRPLLWQARIRYPLLNVDDRLVAIGGTRSQGTPASAMPDVEIRLINADGTVGPMQVLSSGLALPAHSHTAHRIGANIHVIGGATESSVYQDNQRATIGADGVISNFTTVDEPKLKVGRASHGSVVVGNYLYVVGGTTASGDTTTVERAVIHPDGTLGAFEDYTAAPLLQPRHGHGVYATRSTLYVLGGSNGSTALASVESAPVQPDGSIGPFSTDSLVLPVAQEVHTVLAIGGAIYPIGAKIYRNVVKADGTLGSFEVISDAFAGPPGIAVARDEIYVAGGYSDGVTSSISRASLNTTGELSKFALDSTKKLADKRSGAVVFVSGNYVHVVGGSNAAGATIGIQRSAIAADDSLLGFESVGTALVTPRTAAAGFTYRFSGGTAYVDYFYIAGGANGASPAMSSLERARINADGSLSAFENLLFTSMATPRYSHRIVIAPSPTAVGGATSTSPGTFTPLTSIESATTNSDNTDLGKWTTYTSMYFLKTARFGHGLIRTGPAYWALGSNGVTTIETVDVRDFDIGFGVWATSSIATDVTKDFSLLAMGPYTYIIGGGATTSRSRLGDATPMSFATYPDAGLQISRSAPGAVVIGNRAYVLGGASSGSPLDTFESATLK